ncbi:MAG TPA: fasciclin domain-containing protein [Steroidobacteraceae bacterium]|nr:fasciclin domain-containing protein [Steroidobacteraceae bacterium]
MSKRIVRVLALAGALAFGAAGVAQAQSPVPGKPGTLNIVETASAVNQGPLGEFDYLLAAATCDAFDGAVVALLTGTDKYTVFAPSDAAFENLLRTLFPAETPTPAKLCADDPKLPLAAVLEVLTYHVTDGRRFSNSVFNERSVKMVEMLNQQYIVTNPNLTINDVAGQVVRPVVYQGTPLVNINASNGVIHVIDTVLLPFAP